MNKLMIALALLCACCQGAAAQAPDYAREQRIADEIVPAIVVGDPVRLEGEDRRSFLALYTKAPQAKGAVIMVHGFGVNPDWGLIGELRANLAENGYSTLSIQMPVLSADAKVEEYPVLFPVSSKRIAAAVQSLQTKGYRKIAIVSHSMGSRMSNEFLAANPRSVAAWVAISIPADYHGTDQFRFPVLDLYGGNDLPQILAGAKGREAVMHALKDSKQEMVPQADHFFNDHYKELDAQVNAFLDQALR
jgi:dienelactone hydrolase